MKGPIVNRLLTGFACGVAAAAVWAASEPVLRRVTRSDYSDVRLLADPISRTTQLPGLALHCVNGGVFGAGFTALGLSGVRQGVVCAEVESAGLWPVTVLFDRFHPTVRSGEWRPIFRDPRAFSHSMLGHLVFGATLGALTGLARR
jgi:hypothetical protein